MFLATLPLFLFAQRRFGKPVIGNYFGITAEAGFTSFFGDIGEGPAKGDLSNNLAYKIKANWNVKKIIDFSGRISMGEISGEKKRTSGGETTYYYFENDFIEYTFDAGLNVLAPFLKSDRDKFEIYVNVGLGLIDFKVRLYDGTNDSVVKTFGYGGQQTTTEFVLPIGGRAIYHISRSSAVSVQTTLSRVDTDKLDGQTGNDNSDFYNFLSVGYTYKIPSSSSKRRGYGTGRLSPAKSRYRR